MYDINFYIKNPYKETILELAKSQALEVHQGIIDKRISIEFSKIKRRLLSDETRKLYTKVFDLSNNNETLKYELGYLYALSDALRNGPKIIFPSFQECLALENIKIDIPYTEYRQPYTTILVEFPLDYQKSLAERTQRPAAKAVISHYDHKLQFGYWSFIYKAPGFHDVHSFINFNDKIHNDQTKTIEEVLDQAIRKNDDIDIQIMATMERVIMNINLIMISRGIKSKGFLNSKLKVHQARIKPNDMEIISFAQEIFTVERNKYIDNTPIGTHSSPKPHWRCGHHRHQHYGKNNSLVKLIFIKPVFVCYNNQPLDQTSVAYQNVLINQE